MFYVFSPRLISLIKDLDVVDCLAPHTTGWWFITKLLSLRTNEKMNLLRKIIPIIIKLFIINFRVCVKIIKSYVNFLLLPPLRAKHSEVKLFQKWFHKFCPCLLANRDILLNHATNNHFLFFLRIFFFANSVDNLEITYVSCGSLWPHPALQKHLSAKWKIK